MNNINSSSSKINLQALEKIHHAAGVSASVELKHKSTELLDGHFSYQSIQKGLHIHYGEFTELSAAAISQEVSPVISINIVFDGSISFALGGKHYQVSGSNDQVGCSVFSLNQTEPFTRYMQPGMKVKKLNISVERAWFEKRWRQKKQVEQIGHIFRHHADVRIFTPSPDMIDIAHRLINTKVSTDLSQDLMIEASVLQLLIASITHCTQKTQITSSLSNQIKKLINEESRGKSLSLDEIAELLNLSVSTLQRRFKSEFGMTVIDFSRKTRLEKAKDALINDRISIGEASFLAGYKHSSNFISAFTKYFSAPPSRYTRAD